MPQVPILKLKDNQPQAPNEALGYSQSIIFLLFFHLFSIEVPLMACLLSAPNNFWFGFNWCTSSFAQIKSQNIYLKKFFHSARKRITPYTLFTRCVLHLSWLLFPVREQSSRTSRETACKSGVREATSQHLPLWTSVPIKATFCAQFSITPNTVKSTQTHMIRTMR